MVLPSESVKRLVPSGITPLPHIEEKSYNNTAAAEPAGYIWNLLLQLVYVGSLRHYGSSSRAEIDAKKK